jgi:hypothetical protein
MTPDAVQARCGARTRLGPACRRKALCNGRCRNHGGLSTGPKTTEGWDRTREGYRAWLSARQINTVHLNAGAHARVMGSEVGPLFSDGLDAGTKTPPTF